MLKIGRFTFGFTEMPTNWIYSFFSDNCFLALLRMSLTLHHLLVENLINLKIKYDEKMYDIGGVLTAKEAEVNKQHCNLKLCQHIILLIMCILTAPTKKAGTEHRTLENK